MLSTAICGVVFLKFAMTLNIFTRRPSKKDMGDGFYYSFFHVWLQPVSAEEAHKSNECQSFLSFFVSNYGSAEEHSLSSSQQRPAVAAGCQMDEAKRGGVGESAGCLGMAQMNLVTKWNDANLNRQTDRKAGG